MDLVKQALDPTMFQPHHCRGAFVQQSCATLEAREQKLFLPDDVSLQSSLEFGKKVYGSRHVAGLLGSECAEKLIQLIMILPHKVCNDVHRLLLPSASPQQVSKGGAIPERAHGQWHMANGLK
jgi:hypothetical protein